MFLVAEILSPNRCLCGDGTCVCVTPESQVLRAREGPSLWQQEVLFEQVFGVM